MLCYVRLKLIDEPSRFGSLENIYAFSNENDCASRESLEIREAQNVISDDAAFNHHRVVNNVLLDQGHSLLGIE